MNAAATINSPMCIIMISCQQSHPLPDYPNMCHITIHVNHQLLTSVDLVRLPSPYTITCKWSSRCGGELGFLRLYMPSSVPHRGFNEIDVDDTCK